MICCRDFYDFSLGPLPCVASSLACRQGSVADYRNERYYEQKPTGLRLLVLDLLLFHDGNIGCRIVALLSNIAESNELKMSLSVVAEIE